MAAKVLIGVHSTHALISIKPRKTSIQASLAVTVRSYLHSIDL